MSNAYKDSHKRINEFLRIPDDELTAKNDEITIADFITHTYERDKWYTVLDGDEDAAKRFILKRVAMLSDNGMIPASNLPSYIEYIAGCVDGEMKSDGFYVNGSKVTPDISILYRDTISHPDYISLYRWAYTTVHPNGYFINCPVSYRIVDGKGTTVIDVGTNSNLKRYVNLVIGPIAADSSDPTGNNPIAINSSNQLYHKIVLNGIKTTAEIDVNKTDTQFGETFKIPYVSVNATGHTYMVSSNEVTVPSTMATVANKGLVKISNTVPLHISTSNTIGDIALGVALANHSHAAYTLNVYRDGTTDNKIKYDMSGAQSYDMTDILHTYLLSNSPVKENIISPYEKTGSIYKSKWKSLFGVGGEESASRPQVSYLFASVSTNVSLTSGDYTCTMSNPQRLDEDVMSITNNTMTLDSRFGYLVDVSFGIKFAMSGASSYGYEGLFGVGDGTANGTRWQEFNVDGEYVDDFQYKNLSFIVYNISSLKLMLKDNSGNPAFMTAARNATFSIKKLSVARLK